MANQRLTLEVVQSMGAGQRDNKSDRQNFVYFDNQRMVVSHFYQKLSILYKEKILPTKLVFETWNEKNLRILDLIVIPIEETFEDYSQKTIDKLNKLFEDSKEYS